MNGNNRETTRRAIVAGIAAAPVAGLPSFADATPSSPSAELDALWAEFISLGPKIVDASARVGAATNAMPAWAKPGPKYITRDGRCAGEIVDEPMDETVLPPDIDSHWRIIRKSLADARHQYKLTQNWSDAAHAKRNYVAQLGRLAGLRMRQKAEMRKVGLPELKQSRYALIWRQGDVANAILSVEDHSANAVAAKIIVAAFFQWMEPGPIDLDVFEEFTPALIALQPGLTGQVAVDIAAIRARWEAQS